MSGFCLDPMPPGSSVEEKDQEAICTPLMLFNRKYVYFLSIVIRDLLLRDATDLEIMGICQVGLYILNK